MTSCILSGRLSELIIQGAYILLDQSIFSNCWLFWEEAGEALPACPGLCQKTVHLQWRAELAAGA